MTSTPEEARQCICDSRDAYGIIAPLTVDQCVQRLDDFCSNNMDPYDSFFCMARPSNQNGQRMLDSDANRELILLGAALVTQCGRICVMDVHPDDFLACNNQCLACGTASTSSSASQSRQCICDTRVLTGITSRTVPMCVERTVSYCNTLDVYGSFFCVDSRRNLRGNN